MWIVNSGTGRMVGRRAGWFALGLLFIATTGHAQPPAPWIPYSEPPEAPAVQVDVEVEVVQPPSAPPSSRQPPVGPPASAPPIPPSAPPVPVPTDRPPWPVPPTTTLPPVVRPAAPTSMARPSSGGSLPEAPTVLPSTGWPVQGTRSATPAGRTDQDLLIRRQTERILEQEQRIRQQEEQIRQLRLGQPVPADGWSATSAAPTGGVPESLTATAEASDRDPSPHGRSLQGHFFIPSDLLQDPFVVTRFGSRTGFGSQTGTATLKDQTEQDFTAFFLSQGFTLSLALGQAWGLEGEARGNFFTGDDYDTVMASGVQGGYQVAGRTKVRLVRTSWFQSALYLHGGTTKDYLVDFDAAMAATEAAVEDEAEQIDRDIKAGKLNPTSAKFQEELKRRLIPDDSVAEDNLMSMRYQSFFGGGVSLALGLHSTIGLVGSAQLEYRSERLERPETAATANEETTLTAEGVQLEVGAMLNLDLAPATPLPLGLTLLYRRNQYLDDPGAELEAQNSDVFGGGLFYTGRDCLSLGIEMTAAKQQEDTAYSGSLRLWYYW